MDKYVLERDGQFDFYKVFLPRVNPTLEIENILADNNDGVLNGNLLEFKLHVTDLNAVLLLLVFPPEMIILFWIGVPEPEILKQA